MQPASVAPPPSGVPGLWSRISSTGAVDAQGLGLTHPMTWLDERLFGWSHSATRGTNAWSGDAPHPAEGDESDESDSGDYEHVIAYLPEPVNGSPRSRANSYADLQKLKLAPCSAPTDFAPGTTPMVELDGIHFTRAYERKRPPSHKEGAGDSVEG